MLDFYSWLQLLSEDWREVVPQAVLHGYELEFQRAVEQLKQRTTDPALQQQFQAILDCPVKDARGQCRKFAEYIMSALIRNGVHHRYEVEGALLYVVQQMLLDKSPSTGQPRPTLFSGFDAQRSPDVRAGLQARFMSFLKFAIGNIVRGKIRRLSNTPNWPTGTQSITPGRQKEGDPAGGVSADKIAARPSTDAGFNELVSDINDLLRQKEQAYGLPLADLFAAIVAGKNSAQQRQQFGDTATRTARPIIVRIIRDYAESSGNYQLLALVDKFKDFHGNQPAPLGRSVAQQAKPVLSEKERDYRSIVSVIEKFQRPVGSADLGRYRRRWLEYPSRTPGYRNRLEQVLHDMVEDRVLLATRSRQGAVLYSPGPNFNLYQSLAKA